MSTASQLNKLHPLFGLKVRALILNLAAGGLYVGIPESTGGLRTLDQQRQINPADTRVVDPLDSYHVWGLAADLAIMPQGFGAPHTMEYPLESDSVWQRLGAASRAVGLKWGGDFHSIKDMDHVESAEFGLVYLKSTFKNPDEFIRQYQRLVIL